MTKRLSRPSSSASAAKAEENDAPEETTSSRFRDLAKKLAAVPMEQVKAEERREKAAKARKRRKASS